MPKKTLTFIILVAIIAGTTYLGYRSLEGLKDFDFNDPFEVEFDDE